MASPVSLCPGEALGSWAVGHRRWRWLIKGLILWALSGLTGPWASAQDSLAAAEAAFRQGRFAAAQAGFTDILAAPNTLAIYRQSFIYLALIALAEGDGRRAEGYLQGLLVLAPDYTDAAAVIGAYPELEGLLSPAFTQRLNALAQRYREIRQAARALLAARTQVEGLATTAAGGLTPAVQCLFGLQRQLAAGGTANDIADLLAQAQPFADREQRLAEAGARLGQLPADLVAAVTGPPTLSQEALLARLNDLSDRLASLQTTLAREATAGAGLREAVANTLQRACGQYRRASALLDRERFAVGSHWLVPVGHQGYRLRTTPFAVEILPRGGVFLDQFEVTNGQFAEFVAATATATLAETQGSIVFDRRGYRFENLAHWRNPRGDGVRSPQWPQLSVVHITAAEAEAYCRHRGLRLPSITEWQLACRALPASRTGDYRGVNYALRFGELLAVNRAGGGGALSHLLGNAAEFVTSPQAGEAAAFNVGGSWYSSGRTLACDDVRSRLPEARTNAWGFRCAVGALSVP